MTPPTFTLDDGTRRRHPWQPDDATVNLPIPTHQRSRAGSRLAWVAGVCGVLLAVADLVLLKILNGEILW